jgi:hypothetical protein
MLKANPESLCLYSIDIPLRFRQIKNGPKWGFTSPAASCGWLEPFHTLQKGPLTFPFLYPGYTIICSTFELSISGKVVLAEYCILKHYIFLTMKALGSELIRRRFSGEIKHELKLEQDSIPIILQRVEWRAVISSRLRFLLSFMDDS